MPTAHAPRGWTRLAAALVIGCWPFFAFPATAATILKFGYVLSADSQLGAGAAVFAAEVARRTDGRYLVEDYPNAMLGGDVAMMRHLQLGVIDVAFVTGGSLATLVPEAGVFNIPFLFRSATQARAFFDSPLGSEYLRKFDETGVVALAWGENGMRHITNSRRPIHRPEDLVGMKLRIPQSDVTEAGFRALGVDVQQMPFTQVYGALRNGQVDGEENSILAVVSSRFAEVQKHLTLTGHVYDPAAILMSGEAFATLSAADRDAFRAAAQLAGLRSREAAAASEKQGVETLRAAGLTVVDTLDMTPFADKAASATPFFEAHFGREVIARIRNTGTAQASPGAAR